MRRHCSGRGGRRFESCHSDQQTRVSRKPEFSRRSSASGESWTDPVAQLPVSLEDVDIGMVAENEPVMNSRRPNTPTGLLLADLPAGSRTAWASDTIGNGLVPRQAAWYRKPQLAFSDALATVRHRLWIPETFEISPDHRDSLKIREFSIRSVEVKRFGAIRFAGIGCLSRAPAPLRDRLFGPLSMGSVGCSGWCAGPPASAGRRSRPARRGPRPISARGVASRVRPSCALHSGTPWQHADGP